ncbi:sensor histidine kinase [Pseudoduganella sp. RAF53_2]|uniref:sensor histidine kinase n=1 Tax=unclassified Pseudoduganella TaxID=2637179 RepID=UPI003F9E38F7
MSAMPYDAPSSLPALLIALAALALIGGVYLWRTLRARARSHAQVRARQLERERIARALHDTLLQGVQSLTLRLQTVINPLPTKDPLRVAIESILDEADQMVVAGRDQVMDLRAGMEFGSDLASTLRAAVQGMAAEHGKKYKFAVEGTPTHLHPLVSDDIYCIAREALSNAFRHGDATVVEVLLSYGRNAFRLHVRDNGRGIDEQTLGIGGRRGHWGLTGMRERAACIGGQLDIWSGMGKGTEVVLTLDGPLAYGQGASRASQQWLDRILFRH